MSQRDLIAICQAMLIAAALGMPPAAYSQLSPDALVGIAYDSKSVDRRIPLTASVNRHQVTVAMFVNRNSPTFEADSKIAALNVAKALIDADITVTGVLSQFKSQQFDDYKEVFVGGGDVTAYSAGRKSKQEILDSLELVSVPVDPSDSKSGASTVADSGAVGDGTTVASIDGRLDGRNPLAPSGTTDGGKPVPGNSPSKKPAGRGDGINQVPEHSAKDRLFSHNGVAFWYPPNWNQRKVSPNYWATPDEHEVAEFACAVRTGHPFISLARFDRISLTERLTTDTNVGTAFELGVAPPESIKIGYRGALPATQIVSTGRNGQLYFKRIYFAIGAQLYALTLRCKEAEASTLDRDFVRILSTVHSPIRKAK